LRAALRLRVSRCWRRHRSSRLRVHLPTTAAGHVTTLPAATRPLQA